MVPSVLRHCWLGGRKGIRPVKISALHLSTVAISSTSFGWGKGRNVTSAGWQVTLCECDPIWHVSTRSGEAGGSTLQTAILYLLSYFLLCVKIKIVRTVYKIKNEKSISITNYRVCDRPLTGINVVAGLCA